MKDNQPKPNLLVSFGKNYLASQISCMIGLTCTNILEVMKVRKMVDSYHCQPSHYQSKSRLAYYLNSARDLFRPNTMTKNGEWKGSLHVQPEIGYVPQQQPALSTASGVYTTPHAFNSEQHVALDRLKQSVSRNMDYIEKLPRACKECLPEGNILEISRKLIQREGVQNIFFGGLKSAIFSSMIRVGIFFPTRDVCIEAFKQNFAPDHFLNQEFNRSIASTILARTVSSFASFPFEVRKIDSQQKSGGRSLQIRKILSDWKMMSVFLQYNQKEMLSSLVFWVTFEKVKGNMKNQQYNATQGSGERQNGEFWLNVKCAMVSGFLSSLATHPNDYLTTLTNVLKKDTSGQNGALTVINKIKQRNGLSSILAGSLMRANKNMFLNGIFFYFYQSIKAMESFSGK